MLSATDSLSKAPLRTHFKAYTIYGLELNILAYVKTTDFDVYLDEINQLNLNILALLSEHKCKVQIMPERIVD